MKAYLEFTVDIVPSHAVQLLLEDWDLKTTSIFKDTKTTVGNVKEISILVFEMFFARNMSTATLTVTIDNFSDVTVVKCISSGNGGGIFDIGWGAGKRFIKPVRKTLEPHIIEVMKKE